MIVLVFLILLVAMAVGWRVAMLEGAVIGVLAFATTAGLGCLLLLAVHWITVLWGLLA